LDEWSEKQIVEMSLTLEMLMEKMLRRYTAMSSSTLRRDGVESGKCRSTVRSCIEMFSYTSPDIDFAEAAASACDGVGSDLSIDAKNLFSVIKTLSKRKLIDGTAENLKSEGADRESKCALNKLEKHDRQNICFLSLLRSTVLSSDAGDYLCVEFGAGKAALSRWMVNASAIAAINRNDDSQGNLQSVPTQESLAMSPAKRIRREVAPLLYQRKVSFVLLEREARKNKSENKDLALPTSSSSSSLETTTLRLRLDIKDFDFGSLLMMTPSVKDDSVLENIVNPREFRRLRYGFAERLEAIKLTSQKMTAISSWPPSTVLCVSKHLCGAGTDLAITAIMKAITAYRKQKKENRQQHQQEQQETAADAVTFQIALGTCCHHCCSVDTYVGLEFLPPSTKIEEDEENPKIASFHFLKSLVGWGTIGDEEHNATGAAVDGERKHQKSSKSSPPPMMTKVGFLAKRILDVGRLMFIIQAIADMKENLKRGGGDHDDNAEVFLETYVPRTLTPENVVILAKIKI
jgi:hypothetical protein